MAMADYRLCDKCGTKAFYDSNLNYEWPTKDHPIPDDEMVRDSHIKMDRLGDWAVLCVECKKTHKCVVVPLVERRIRGERRVGNDYANMPVQRTKQERRQK